MSLLMAMAVSQAAASEYEEAQENQENPMDGRTTAADFQELFSGTIDYKPLFESGNFDFLHGYRGSY